MNHRNPMFHPNRRHFIKGYVTPEQLVGDIKRCTWTLCSGFRWSSILLLNDALSEDGYAEYAVIKLTPTDTIPLRGQMIETLTTDWFEHADLVAHLRRYEAEGSGFQLGEYIQRPHPEGPCHACA